MTAPDAANTPPNRRIAPSGAVRDARNGKGRYDLIHPLALRMLAERMEEGAAHYGERNWEKGQLLSWFVDSGKRHLDSYMLTGDRADLAGYLWNAHGLAATAEMIRLGILPATLDDLPHYLSAKGNDHGQTTVQRPEAGQGDRPVAGQIADP